MTKARHTATLSPPTPFAAIGQNDLLAELMENPERRQQLRHFSAAYLGVEVQDALATEADRLGFTVLGKPTVAGE
jgi:hypothetical protein